MACRLAHRAWDSLGNGALFSTRIPPALHRQAATSRLITFHAPERPRPVLVFHPTRLPRHLLHTTIPTRRQPPPLTEKPPPTSPAEVGVRRYEDPADRDDDEVEDAPAFKSSDKAAAARQVNLSARLSKDDSGGRKGGVQEVGRLLAIARPEVRTLGVALACLLVSSSISMSVPFSVGEFA